MPERTAYAQGTPNWVDLPTTDQDAAKAFYAGLFGWTYDDQPMDEGAVYSLAKLGDHMVAAISPQPPEMAAAGARWGGGRPPPMMEGVPNHWHVYFAVEDTDASAAKVTELGGTVLVPPFDTPVGKIAVVQDPQGAAFSIMTPAPQPG